jgi:hypothetical protein
MMKTLRGYILAAVFLGIALGDAFGGGDTSLPVKTVRQRWHFYRTSGAVLDTTDNLKVAFYPTLDDTAGAGLFLTFSMADSLGFWFGENVETDSYRPYIYHGVEAAGSLMVMYDYLLVEGRTVRDSMIRDTSAFYNHVVPRYAIKHDAVGPDELDDDNDFAMRSLIITGYLEVGDSLYVKHARADTVDVEDLLMIKNGGEIVLVGSGQSTTVTKASGFALKLDPDKLVQAEIDSSELAALAVGHGQYALHSIHADDVGNLEITLSKLAVDSADSNKTTNTQAFQTVYLNTLDNRGTIPYINWPFIAKHDTTHVGTFILPGTIANTGVNGDITTNTIYKTPSEFPVGCFIHVQPDLSWPVYTHGTTAGLKRTIIPVATVPTTAGTIKVTVYVAATWTATSAITQEGGSNGFHFWVEGTH